MAAKKVIAGASRMVAKKSVARRQRPRLNQPPQLEQRKPTYLIIIDSLADYARQSFRNSAIEQTVGVSIRDQCYLLENTDEMLPAQRITVARELRKILKRYPIRKNEVTYRRWIVQAAERLEADAM